MKTPVAFIIFKRPDTTEQVFQAIRQAKPPKLFVIADGPRTDRPEEVQKCELTRATIERVDWDCEVLNNYSDINLGCAKRVSSGLDWVFDQVEEAIILEDDCVPNPTFFPFCEELLDKYRYDNRVASISGQNVQFGRKRTNYSYYFSRYNHCWGWATWRRAWQHFDIQMKLWTEIQEGGFLNDILTDRQAVDYWTSMFESVFANPASTIWSYQWTFACWVQSSLGIISNVNLISNIGFGLDSTNVTANQKQRYGSLPTEAIDFPIKHPPFIIRDFQADSFTQETLFRQSKLQLLKQRLNKLLKY
ncbi:MULTISPECIES: glycosyltransferase family 2 protein [Nostoc]|uniref:Glycosyltransferase family 2 protein n=1 Tax=Nostoc paludosum FACHB-159 TaxID=2692908 RepID=A0ABR8JYU7_9NOSO|nr:MULTISPECIES: glycosyltransferase family 2 protein [Nostoc]MBD2676356.1 glycosyltransferase family 2 protein [Nostoc sp. FACHB-857]MBD2732516.1 glycosyltransferase family 2 protein [Nostoc paludosum FACHB-159]